MNLHLKNTLSALFISTAIVACGGGGDGSKSSSTGSPPLSQPNTSTNQGGDSSNSTSTGSAPSSQSNTSSNPKASRTNDIKSAATGIALQSKSVGDGSIRLDIIYAIEKSHTDLMAKSTEFLKTVDTQKNINYLQALLRKSTNDQERDLLKMNIQFLSGRIEIYKNIRPWDDTRQEAEKQLAKLKITDSKLFIQKYIQSTQLRSLMLQFRALEEEYLEMNSDNQSENAAFEVKAFELQQNFISLSNDPNLDEQTRKEFALMYATNLIPKFMLEKTRKFAYPTGKPLSANTPNPTEDVSLRRARNQEPHADFSQLMVNGVSGGYATLSMPVYLQLKGTIEGSKETTGLTGLVVYKLNNTLVGIIHGYANASSNRLTPLNHNESSVVVSHSFGKGYLEGQAGFVRSSINQHDVSGDRYQLAAGYDFEYVTPFVQASVRNLNGLNEHSVQAGCEVDILNLVTDQYKLSTRMTLKGGYHSFKGTVGSIEGSFELGFNNGVHIQTGFKASSKDASTAQISLSFDQ